MNKEPTSYPEIHPMYYKKGLVTDDHRQFCGGKRDYEVPEEHEYKRIEHNQWSGWHLMLEVCVKCNRVFIRTN